MRKKKQNQLKRENPEKHEKCPECGSIFIMYHMHDESFKMCMECKYNWKD